VQVAWQVSSTPGPPFVTSVLPTTWAPSGQSFKALSDFLGRLALWVLGGLVAVDLFRAVTSPLVVLGSDGEAGVPPPPAVVAVMLRAFW
jgi:hypothetical protein